MINLQQPVLLTLACFSEDMISYLPFSCSSKRTLFGGLWYQCLSVTNGWLNCHVQQHSWNILKAPLTLTGWAGLLRCSVLHYRRSTERRWDVMSVFNRAQSCSDYFELCITVWSLIVVTSLTMCAVFDGVCFDSLESCESERTYISVHRKKK